MESKLLNRSDLDFLLYELLEVESLTARPRFADHSRETFTAALDAAEAIATEKFAPHNRRADLEEPRFEGGRVHVIAQVKEALDAYIEAGFMAAGQSYEYGGMQLPAAVAVACGGYFSAASVGIAAYEFLTRANANLLMKFGTPAQIERYALPQLAGRFFGTMCLSETQAGSSLADIRTTAVPLPDGSYSITGAKMWISGGEHELAENIVHLVLARIQGAPAGVKGLSLFIVPRNQVHADGSVGDRNGVVCVGLNHKMGYRGIPNCVLSFGDNGDCRGELVGAPNQGLACMFHMMNEARIGVGIGATVLGYTGYLHALDYARNRPQGRPLGVRDPAAPPVPIIEHADVRRMLLAQKAYVEGGLALCLYAARLLDEEQSGESEQVRARSRRLLDLLTPLVKAWPSEWCLRANDLAIQVYGGYGYTREYPVEQFYRDNRLNPIHEGTDGIQALDLLGRKVLLDRGEGLEFLLEEMRPAIAAAAVLPGLEGHSKALAQAFEQVIVTTQALARAYESEPGVALANASVYLDMLGHTVVAWLWLRQALVAEAALARSDTLAAAFYHGKLQACRYFFHWELPKTQAQHELLRALDLSCLAMANEWF